MINRICYFIILKMPHQFQLTRLGGWMLPRAGEYAFSDTSEAQP